MMVAMTEKEVVEVMAGQVVCKNESFISLIDGVLAQVLVEAMVV